MRRALILLTVLGCSSHQVGKLMGAGVSTAVGATVVTAGALAASAASRAMGGCYAICQQGEVCNSSTGLCEALPCRGLCGAGERCTAGFFGDKCVQSGGADQAVSTKARPASGVTGGAIHIE